MGTGHHAAVAAQPAHAADGHGDVNLQTRFVGG